ncbi:MAG: 5-formyltetrahydrofolate cyclo-ligase [Gammaproteobacteria bacterium]|nr:MAG: 5-formyltetrahydrofolate cyclo-ligase [Gammaproteobacteria bacterium]
MINSSQLRKNILTARNNLTTDQLRKQSRAVQKNFLGQKEIIYSRNIFVYVSFRSEVETLDLIKTFLKSGKTVTVPVTRVKEKRLDAIQINDPETDLVPGYCNIPEPRAEICLKQKTDPADIDIILLPGSVFDERGGRFGYGGGYYDRFVSSAPRALRVGLAFNLQIIERAPLQCHDEILDLIVTETRIIRGKR